MFVGHNVQYKSRLVGDEFKIIDDKYELFIETFIPSSQYLMKKPRYSIEGDINLDLANALKEFHNLVRIIKQNGTHFCISYYPDKDDESIELELRSVGYYSEYEKMRIK